MTGEIVTFAIGMIVCVPFSGDELSDETPKLPNMSASTSNEGKRKPMSHRLSPISAQVGVSTETATIYGAGMSRCHKTVFYFFSFCFAPFVAVTWKCGCDSGAIRQLHMQQRH
ncbi:uncharacterized protein LOC118505887 isoform X3 [Anopheles stephensi]|uniref:uncharacterized protein LOC118505887 isoform X3 n=1 Tax=Anopheles stephensi TaxID=30069 RepID=UPI0016588391|nr:uncharacterized protein LOC118505887 isoform X3 [Anopheles stephensi]